MCIGLLALPACSGMIPEQLIAPYANSPAILLHDGGNMGDDCVFDVIVTGGTAVAMAINPPAGAIGIILSWSLLGVEVNATAEACFDSWRNQVDPNLRWRNLERFCAAGSIALYDDCMLDGWAKIRQKEAMVAAVGEVVAAGAYLGWCYARFASWDCQW